MLEVLGIPFSSQWFDGASLLHPYVDQNRIVFSIFPGRTNLMETEYAAMDDEYRLVHRQDKYYLYRYKQDPKEEINLIDHIKQSNDSQFLRLQLALQEFEKRTIEVNQGKDIYSLSPIGTLR